MKGTTGKPPARQWYFKDWLSDRKLARAEASSRGIWMDLLSHLMDCPLDDNLCDDGTLSWVSIPELMKLGRCSEAEAWQFVQDAFDHDFCDIEALPGGHFHITSRRIKRETSTRRKWREDKRRQRNERDVHQPVHNKSTKNPTVSSFPTPIPSPTNTNVLDKRPPKKVGSQISKNFNIDEKMAQYAIDRKVDPHKVEDLFEAFRDYHEAKGTVCKNWRAAWQTWVRNAPEFSKWAMKKNYEREERINERNRQFLERHKQG